MPSSNVKSNGARPPESSPPARAAEVFADRVRWFSAELASRAVTIHSFASLEPNDGDDVGALRAVLRELREEHEELRTAEEELRTQNDELARSIASAEEDRRRHREIFDAVSDALVVTDRFGVMQDINVAALGVLALDRRSDHGKPFSLLLRGGDTRRWYAALRELKASGSTVSLSLSAHPRGAAPLPVVATCTLVDHGTRVLVSVRRVEEGARPIDHGDRIADLERALRDKEELLARERDARWRLEHQSRATARFLELLGHDLRGPIHAVLGWADLLTREALAKSARDKALSVISRSARMQLGLVDQLLDVFRVTEERLPFEVRPLEIGALVERVCAGFSSTCDGAGVTLSVDVAIEAGSVLFGDRARLEQVVTNLLSNAVKFTPPGGNVRVSVCRDGDHVVLRVADDGRGIAPGHLETLFACFGHARRGDAPGGGVGLGLYVAKRLVELHGGSIAAESDGLGRGATFTVRLPARGSGADAERTTATETSDRIEGVRVLVVDEDADARDLLATVLAERGASTALARDAAEAIALVGSFRPDVLVSDLGLTDEDGVSLLRRIRQLAPDLAAIALSGSATPADVSGAVEAGFDAHLAKPLVVRKLLDAIAALTRGR